MIIDKLENAAKYLPDNADCRAVLQFLKETDLKTLAVGKHVIYGDTYVNVMESDTKPCKEIKLEAHVKYVDLQVIITGEECALYDVLDGHKIAKEYDAENDYALYYADKPERFVVNAGEFAILMPEHLHQFGICAHEPMHIKKAVFKIPVWSK